jgi:thiol-disulfide isomerase/thioredoxin
MKNFLFLVLISFSCKSQVSEPQKVGNSAPDLNVALLMEEEVGSNEIFDFSRYDYTLVNFWASWCNPCIREMPIIDSFYRTVTNEKIAVVGVTRILPYAGGKQKWKDELVRHRNLIRAIDVSYPILVDMSGKATEDYGVEELPHTFLIDQKGIIIAEGIGTEKTLELITQLKNIKN